MVIRRLLSLIKELGSSEAARHLGNARREVLLAIKSAVNTTIDAALGEERKSEGVQ